MANLLFMSGSARKESLNTKLAKYAASIAEKAGHTVEYIDLNALNLPIFNEDDETANGMPPNAHELKRKFHAADGYFIASPEYNSSYSSLLKNSIDWVSRPHGTDEVLEPYKGKIAAISAVSPGGLGGMRVLVVLRMLLGNLGVHVVPTQAAIGNGLSAFDEQGALQHENQIGMFNAVMADFTNTVLKMKS